MKYDFDSVIDRTGMYSAKMEETKTKFGRDDIIPMWIADMDFVMAQPVIDTMVEKARHGIWGYTSRDDKYFEAVQSWMKHTRNWEPEISKMSHALGGLPMLANIVHTFTKPGDRVLIQPPVFSEFKTVIDNWDLEMVVNPLIEENNEYRIDFEDLRDKAKDSDFMIFCNPHNPIGRVWTKDEVKEVAKICHENKVQMISDEMFGDMMLFGEKFIAPASLDEVYTKNIITCTSIAKTFNMAGLQVATCILPTVEMKEAFDKTLAKIETKRNNTFSIHANQVAMTQCFDWYDQSLAYITENIKYAMSFIDENIPNVRYTKPSAAYLLWLDFRNLGMSQEELMSFLVNEAKLGLNDGTSFGVEGEGFMRMNLGTPRVVVKKALEQLCEAVNSLDIDKTK